MNQALGNLLGAFIGSQSPRDLVNENYIGIDPKTGKYINGEPPYIKPGFGTRLFHPDVYAQVGQLNDAPRQRFINTKIEDAIQGERFLKGRNALNNPFSQWTGEEGAINTGDNPTSSSLLQAETDSALHQEGVPSAQAKRTKATTDFGLRQTVAGLNLGTPEAQAKADDAAARYAVPNYSYLTQRLGYDRSLLPSEYGAKEALNKSVITTTPSTISRTLAENEYLTQRAGYETDIMPLRYDIEGKQLAATDARLPFEVKRDIAEAMMGAGTATSRLRMLPTINKAFQSGLEAQMAEDQVRGIRAGSFIRNRDLFDTTIDNQMTGEAFNSRFLAPAQWRTGSQIKDGKIIPGVVHPLYQNQMMDQFRALNELKNIGGNIDKEGRVVSPDGRKTFDIPPHLLLQPKSYDPITGESLTPKPTIGGGFLAGNLTAPATMPAIPTGSKKNSFTVPTKPSTTTYEDFFKTVKSSKSGHAKDPLRLLAEYVANNIGLPANIKEREAKLWGDSTIRPPSKWGTGPSDVIYNAMQGKDKDLTSEYLTELIKTLPPEAFDYILSEAGYTK